MRAIARPIRRFARSAWPARPRASCPGAAARSGERSHADVAAVLPALHLAAGARRVRALDRRAQVAAAGADPEHPPAAGLPAVRAAAGAGVEHLDVGEVGEPVEAADRRPRPGLA